MGSHPFRVSLSVSPFTQAVLSRGFIIEDSKIYSGSIKAIQEYFLQHGATEVFARICTRKNMYSLSNSDHSLQSALALAQMARELDLPLNPEINLFSIYGDVTGQPGPDFSDYPELKTEKPWNQLNIDEMCVLAEQYGAIIAESILGTGVSVNFWDIGNEVNLGFGGIALAPFPGAIESEMGKDWYLPPDMVDPEIGRMDTFRFLTMPQKDQIEWAREHLWPGQFALMSALAKGISSVDKEAKFSTHITWAHQSEFALAFTKSLIASAFPLDCMGLSLYPTSEASPDESFYHAKQTIRSIVQECGVKVFIAEYAYPAQEPSGVYKEWNKPVTGYPLTPSGQAAFTEDFLTWGMENGLSGIRPWAPDLVLYGWEAFSLFEKQGIKLIPRPVLNVLRGIE